MARIAVSHIPRITALPSYCTAVTVSRGTASADGVQNSSPNPLTPQEAAVSRGRTWGQSP
jgi:hypothetical protein